jgi:hypothetical protein
MLPPVNPPRHLSEAISTKLGPYTSLHSRSVNDRFAPIVLKNSAVEVEGDR